MYDPKNVEMLVEEYETVLADRDSDDSKLIQDELTRSCDWGPKAAEHLVCLANAYGSFMLRNALALALALDIEDGDLGF